LPIIRQNFGHSKENLGKKEKIMNHITREHNHWRLSEKLRELLLECRAGEDLGCSITNISVDENGLVATDGRRLVRIENHHTITPALYFCTSDGFLLEAEGNFPKYSDIIPRKEDLTKIVEVNALGQDITGLILGELIASGCIIKLSFYLKPIEILGDLVDGKMEVFVNSIDPARRPFLVEAETDIGSIKYIQMPLNVKNEVLTSEK